MQETKKPLPSFLVYLLLACFAVLLFSLFLEFLGFDDRITDTAVLISAPAVLLIAVYPLGYKAYLVLGGVVLVVYLVTQFPDYAPYITFGSLGLFIVARLMKADKEIAEAGADKTKTTVETVRDIIEQILRVFPVK